LVKTKKARVPDSQLTQPQLGTVTEDMKFRE